MNFKLKNHPAQARHFRTKKPLTDETGNPVPLFPEQRALYFDDFLIAYVIPGADSCKTLFIVPESNLTKAVCDAAKEFVSNTFQPVGHSHALDQIESLEAGDDDE